MKRTVTFERIGLKILARSEKYGTERLYEAIQQADGTWNLIRYEDGRQEHVAHRENRLAAEKSLDEILDTLIEFAGSRI